MSQPSPARDRRKWPLAIAIVMAVASPVVGFWIYFYSRPRTPAAERSSGHWAAVSMGRAYLAQGQPHLALAAVEHVRDEGPGSGEAMTVAGLALLELKQPITARK